MSLKTILIAAFIAGGIFTAHAQSSIFTDMPAWGLEFEWNTSGTVWDSTGETFFTYYPSGKLAGYEHFVYDSTGFVPSTKLQLAYDANGNRTLNHTLLWDGSAWENYYKSSATYDQYDSITNRLSERWDGTVWELVGESRTTYYQTTAGLTASATTEYYDTTTGTWENGEQIHYQWTPDSMLSQQELYGWDTIALTWRPQQRHQYHYNANDELDTLDFAGGAGFSFVPQSRTTWSWYNYAKRLPYVETEYNYQANGSYLPSFRYLNAYSVNDSRISQYESAQSGGWDTIFKIVTDLDAVGNETLHELYMYSTPNVWTLMNGTLGHFTYDGNNRKIEGWYERSSGGTYEKTERYLYFDFFTGIDEAGPTLPVTAYPNPCSDQLRFRLEEQGVNPVHIALYDLAGRLRMQTVVASHGEIILPISDMLENGTYLYRLSDGMRQASGKVVVQR